MLAGFQEGNKIIINKMKIDLDKFKLQYISAGNTNNQHLQGIKDVLEGGCKWIQLRIKNATDDIKEIALETKELCKNYNAIFLINDYVDLAKETDADGVHLGKLDMNPAEARNILGNKIIGGTANTFADVLELNGKVDYIGLGPYRWTQTKKNLSPTIGIDGYKEIFANIKKENITIPIAAIGGIELADVKELIDIGANGIAVSSNIYNAPNRIQAVKNFLGML